MNNLANLILLVAQFSVDRKPNTKAQRTAWLKRRGYVFVRANSLELARAIEAAR